MGPRKGPPYGGPIKGGGAQKKNRRKIYTRGPPLVWAKYSEAHETSPEGGGTIRGGSYIKGDALGAGLLEPGRLI